MYSCKKSRRSLSPELLLNIKKSEVSIIGNDCIPGTVICRKCGQSLGIYLAEPETRSENYRPEIFGNGREICPDGYGTVIDGNGRERYPGGSDPDTVGPGPETYPEGFDPEIEDPTRKTHPEGFQPGISGSGRETYPEGFDPETGGAGRETYPEDYDLEIYRNGDEANPEFHLDGDEPDQIAAFSTRVAGWKAHLSGRLRKKLAKFDRRITAFRKGGWS